ncbi:hypothetical protein LPUS_10185 [Lasallia pustulata]|uniref:Transcription factor domain-containing protein n=1 Tax=Lasallia pustulata TaxID=136370 RepID=A0A1W5D911_9LECA|nr:hypothetical protein LPUS_10185 [Lasallia pustulata]
MFPVWPVIDIWSLVKDLETAPNDDELYALATSVCAATMAQLRLPVVPVECTGDLISIEVMGSQIVQTRAKFDYRDKISIATVLTSMFLYVLNYNQGKRKAGWVHLQEAIIFAKVLRLDAEEPLEVQSPEYRRGKLVLWLLFVTESGYANSHNVPMTLQSPRCELPSYHQNRSGSESGFRALATLFAHFDEASNSSRRDSDLTKESLAALQAKLQASVSCSSASSKANQTDLVVTQQWMRTLVWQKSMSLMMLSSAPSDQAMSLSFPTQIVGDLLKFNPVLSPECLKPHGVGMQLKLYDIANTLADVILCVPSASGQYSWPIAPQDFLLRLHGLLSDFHKSSPKLYSMLHEKTARALSSCVSPSIEVVEPREHDITESYSSPSDTTFYEDSFGNLTGGQVRALDSQAAFSSSSMPDVAAHAVFPGFREEGSAQPPW